MKPFYLNDYILRMLLLYILLPLISILFDQIIFMKKLLLISATKHRNDSLRNKLRLL